jgi:hypothetical protein
VALWAAASCSGSSPQPISSVAVTACAGLINAEIPGFEQSSNQDEALAVAMRSRDSHLVALITSYRDAFIRAHSGDPTYDQSKAWALTEYRATKYCHDRYRVPSQPPVPIKPPNTQPPATGDPTPTTALG